MAASLIVDRTTAIGALWYLFDGATLYILPCDISDVDPAPETISDDFDNWIPHILAEFTQYTTLGPVSYDATNPDVSKSDQIQIVLDYDSEITYTHIIVGVIPALAPDSGPDYAIPIICFLEEPSAVTLSSSESKTYNIDLTALFSAAT